jgi:hypothetical protein
MSQLELFAEPLVEVRTVPTVESVRARLESILKPLRAGAVRSPKEIARLSLIVPQMTDWLPPEEASAFRAEFEAVVKRAATANGLS